MLFAVHLSDGAIADAWVAGGFAVGALLLLVALYRIREDEVPRIGVLTAASTSSSRSCPPAFTSS